MVFSGLDGGLEKLTKVKFWGRSDCQPTCAFCGSTTNCKRCDFHSSSCKKILKLSDVQMFILVHS